MNEHAHLHHVARRFSRAAGRYDDASDIQAEVARRVLELVPPGVTPRRVLDVGCGTGRLLQWARQRWPSAQLVGLDISKGMIEQARMTLGDDPNATFVLGDASNYDADAPFDLVLSSSSLHWLRPWADGLLRVAAIVRPGGFLVAGLMTAPTLSELRTARIAVAPHKPPPGQLPTTEEVRQVLSSRESIRLHHLDEIMLSLRHPSATALLQALHTMGVTGGDLSHGDVPLQRREIAELIRYYEAHFPAPGGGVTATFSVGYLVVEHL